MPANGGRLTVAEFAENFNQMARVTDSPLRLHSNGAWVRDSLRGYAATLDNAYPSRLEYETDANGYLTAVRFRCSYTAQGGGDPSSAPDFVYASTAFIQPLLLAMLASQDASAQDMAALVNDRWDQGFVYETEDARTSVTVTCYGYVVDRSTGMLISHDASCGFTAAFDIVWN